MELPQQPRPQLPTALLGAGGGTQAGHGLTVLPASPGHASTHLHR